MDKDFSALVEKLQVKHIPGGHFQQAFVHRSYLNEHPEFEMEHNERLEFLGDAVLELVVTENLFRNYPNPEGELTNWRAAIVNGQNLANIGESLGIEEYLYLSKGEKSDAGSKARRYILANTIEAIIGALYLDVGWDEAKLFVDRYVLSTLPNILEKKLYIDPKSRFQEEAQARSSMTPSYKVLDETGPDHNKIFRVGVYLGKELVAEGTGSSKQEAQIQAAENGIAAKKW